MTSPFSQKQNGFSLIELVTVLLLITVLSTIGIRSTIDIGYSARYEQTLERLKGLRKAIVGDPNRLINGQPDISGFVADMGRLPINIHELIEEDFCLTDRSEIDQTTCEALTGGTDWNNQQSAAIGATTKLKYGWRGPYLNVPDDPTMTDTFTDGWGREAQGFCLTSSDTNTLPSACPDVTESDWIDAISDHNYGWYFLEDLDPNNASDLFILSYGKDHISGGTDYDEDYPILKPVVKEDWLVDISSGIQATFTAPFFINTTDRNACIKAGGAWKNACVIDEDKCTTTVTTVTTPALLGHWVSITPNTDPDPDPESFDFCKMREGVVGTPGTLCKAQRGTDNRTGSWKTCHFVSRQSCLLARGEWREKYSQTTDTTCNDVTGTAICSDFTQQQCEGGAGVFENGQCFTCDITDENLCIDSGGDPIGTSPGTVYPNANAAVCKANGGNWDGLAIPPECIGANYCEFTDSQQCRDVGGNWSESCQFDRAACVDVTTGGIAATWDETLSRCSSDLPAQLLFQGSEAAYRLLDIVMEITFRDNGVLEVAQSTNAVVQENGKSQTILFTDFKVHDGSGNPIDRDGDGDVDTDDDVNDLPIGVNGILIAKNYDFNNDIGDIYPASCEGLEGDFDTNAISDCAEAGGTLLDSGLCDNVTIAECEAGADGVLGRLIRNVMQVSFVPRKQTPLIIW